MSVNYFFLVNSLFLLFSYVIRDIARSRAVFVLIVSGLSVASAALLLTIGVLNGFQIMFAESEQGWLADIVISPINDELTIAENSRLEAELAALSGVEAFSVRSQGKGVVRYEEKSVGAFSVIGIDPKTTSETTQLASRAIEGSFFSTESENADEAVLGKTLADSLVGSTDDGQSVRVGDDIAVSGPTGEFRRFRVRGIVDAKTFIPNWSMFLTKGTYEKLDASTRNSSVIVKLKSETDQEQVLQLLRDRFPRANVRTWEEESQYVNDIMQAVSYITRSIHYLLVLTIFTIVSVVIYINISQKKRQIGILKSMGAKNGFVLSAYLLESCVYAGVAFVVGFMLFFVLFWFSQAHPAPLLIGDFRIVFSFDTLVSAWLAIFVATIGGGLVPSMLAARMRIVDVMRGTV